jgi:NADH:ubiquinone oxidoreductase subunit E
VKREKKEKNIDVKFELNKENMKSEEEIMDIYNEGKKKEEVINIIELEKRKNGWIKINEMKKVDEIMDMNKMRVYEVENL